MQITTQLVNELRQKTGAGIVKCKEALVASDGNIDLAVLWLRNTGVKPEKLSQPTGEGLVVTRVDRWGQKAVIFSLKCQTDFAARNPRFIKLANQIANDYLYGGVLAADTVKDLQVEITTGIGENIIVSQPDFVSLPKEVENTGIIANYTHSNNKLAVLIGIKCKNPQTITNLEFLDLAKNLAMHVAGSNPSPKAVDRQLISIDLVKKEQEFIFSQLNSDSNFVKKPETIRQKIVDGKMGKFYRENVLLEQVFVKDETKTVEQYLKEFGEKLNDEFTVLWFVRKELNDN